MEVKVDIKMNKTMMRKLSQAQVQAAEMTVEAVKTDVISKNVFPFDTGTLQNESTTIDTSKKKQGHFAISSNTPYARRLYFHPEYHFRTDNNPNAQGRWYDPWINGKYKRFAPETYKKFYKKLTGV